MDLWRIILLLLPFVVNTLEQDIMCDEYGIDTETGFQYNVTNAKGDTEVMNSSVCIGVMGFDTKKWPLVQRFPAKRGCADWSTKGLNHTLK
uniref:Secreted protein n=1 Tax=Lutzomyia longipalpis TaxID=7200 RepID=A0A1B0CA86_LUTLO